MVQILVQNYFYAPPICAAYAGESATPANAPRNPLVAVLSNCALDSSFVFNPVMGSSLIQQISLLRLCLWRSKSISVNNQLLNTLSVECKSCSHAHQLSSYNDLPKKIMGDLNQCSSVKSMDFHPVQQTLLFVVTSCGGITMW
ncbi:topless-related protein 2-like isoform X3 [Citrus sinensis]|uniref:topless-related protein 2-like isoform X3 n=1 Tax=Citrus sinensis TaxID=2711 RepID=UPI0022779705|nr:topless-related protein 2-like isoform X3 [Citrus sinensis]